jgi:hypothetical protein
MDLFAQNFKTYCFNYLIVLMKMNLFVRVNIENYNYHCVADQLGLEIKELFLNQSNLRFVKNNLVYHIVLLIII